MRVSAPPPPCSMRTSPSGPGGEHRSSPRAGATPGPLMTVCGSLRGSRMMSPARTSSGATPSDRDQHPAVRDGVVGDDLRRHVHERPAILRPHLRE